MERLLCFLLWIPCMTLAQSTLSWDEFMQQLAEEAVDESHQQEWEAQMEALSDLHDHPIDLNRATREQLQQLPFLSETAIDALLDYLSMHGPMRTLGELLLVGRLSPQEGEWLRLFVKVDPMVTQPRDTLHSWWGRSRHEVITRVDVPFYQRAGWPWARGIGHRLRYTWQQGRHLDVGVRLEKDAGEQMFTRDIPFYDSYGGHVQLKDLGVVRQVIVGDFKASFGEGLVLNNGLQFGKSTMSLWRTSNDVRPHRSADEVNFLRGVAGTAQLGTDWRVTALYSIRFLDATVNKDNSVSSINTTGLHRTESELAHKGSLQSQTTALHVAWNRKTWTAGVTGLFQYYNHHFVQNATLYRQIYPIGYLFGAASANYGYRSARLSVKGETARSFDKRGGGWATLNTAAWRFSPQTQLTLIQRFYSKDYFSPHASAYGENGRVQNESGVAVLLDAARVGPFALRALFDYFYSPWPRYTMTRASSGWEGMAQLSWQPRRGRQLMVRYHVKSKERSDLRHFSHQLRATYDHRLSALWDVRLSAFLSRYRQPAQAGVEASSSTGYAAMPQVSYHSRDERLRWALAAILFRTDNYDSRLYLYEPSLAQSYGMQQLYGHGQRFVTALQLRFPHGSGHRSHALSCMAQIKAGVTHYTDRSEISSGPLLISSPWKADLQVLFKMTF